MVFWLIVAGFIVDSVACCWQNVLCLRPGLCSSGWLVGCLMARCLCLLCFGDTVLWFIVAAVVVVVALCNLEICFSPAHWVLFLPPGL